MTPPNDPTAPDRRFKQPALALLALALCLTSVVYWPGLKGYYLFDDYPNFVNNPPVLVTESTVENWRVALLASRSSMLGRPLAMLSFAVNHYLTGLDPFWFKLTNLCLHLLNGVLLFIVLDKLLLLWRRINTQASDNLSTETTTLLAALVASAWLLAPINLTAVLYVVQRMTSIAQIFVLAGLWIYLHGRARQLAGKVSWPWLLGGLFGGVALGLGGKETAILLPGYVLACEITLLGFRSSHGRRSVPLMVLFALLLVIAAILFLFWLLPAVLHGGYDHRPFTLMERLLTQCRVVVEYMMWTLAPDPGALSFYHDDIPVSRSWLNPPSTLTCFGLLVALLFAACTCVRRAPLVSLGLMWFLVAHMLESTLVPLELVFEHRNYFASIGLLLALFSIIMRLSQHSSLRVPAYVLFCALIVWPATVTALRAQDWSDPLRLASSEALIHPSSPRAQYELGRTLILVSDYGRKAPLLEQAITALESAMRLTSASILPEQGLIMMAGHTGQAVDPAWWESIANKLDQRPASAEDISSIHNLLLCQIYGPCLRAPREMLVVFMNTLKHPRPDERLLANYAEFAAYLLDDQILALNVAHEAVAVAGINAPVIRKALGPILRGEVRLPRDIDPSVPRRYPNSTSSIEPKKP